MSRSTIHSLAGEPLSGVAFVQDYMEFHFDGKVLRSLTSAALTSKGRSWRFPEEGSRDAFCGLIGRSVHHVKVEEGHEIELTFTEGSVLRIPLAPAEMSGPEAAHFIPGEDQPIDVW